MTTVTTLNNKKYYFLFYFIVKVILLVQILKTILDHKLSTNLSALTVTFNKKYIANKSKCISNLKQCKYVYKRKTKILPILN